MLTQVRIQERLCERLKQLGYAQSKRIRIYGEEFTVISNPAPDGEGIAVDALPRSGSARKLRVPLPILQLIRKELAIELERAA
ncbi:MAG TPA: hypothetical protein VH744_11955 [Terriglobales bacterium]|jgi:hypothetical protein